jgi:hypothetical protein
VKHYLLSVYQPAGDPPPAAKLEQIMRDVGAVTDEMRASGAWVFSGGLHAPDDATVLDPRRDTISMIDGPYVEAREHIGGLTIVKAASLDEAVAWGRRLAQATTLPIEVRPFQGELED